MLDALALEGEPRAPVESVHRAAERLMRPGQVRRYQVRISISGRSFPDTELRLCLLLACVLICWISCDCSPCKALDSSPRPSCHPPPKG